PLLADFGGQVAELFAGFGRRFLDPVGDADIAANGCFHQLAAPALAAGARGAVRTGLPPAHQRHEDRSRDGTDHQPGEGILEHVVDQPHGTPPNCWLRVARSLRQSESGLLLRFANHSHNLYRNDPCKSRAAPNWEERRIAGDSSLLKGMGLPLSWT